MKNKIVKYLKEAVVFLVALTLFANILNIYRSADLNKEPLKLSNVTLLDNTSYKLPKNKPILIHFWATWCPTCKAEIQNIQTISENYNVLTISFKSGSDKEIHEYLKNHNLNFKVINDADGSITKDYAVSVFPTTIIYNRDGNEIFSDVGYTTTFGLWFRMWLAGL